MESSDLEHESRRRALDSRKKIQPKSLSLRNKLIVQKQDIQSSVQKRDDTPNSLKEIENFAGAGNSASTSTHRRWNDNTLTEKNDDSLCDFRSPVKDSEMNESLADFIVKPTVLKSNKRLGRKESKPVVKKKRSNRDITSVVNQPTIESSFFKPQSTVKTAFLCPLCFKSHKDATAQHSHMKSCAAKNKIPTDKLLEAVKLQEKQANERRAMGLLAAPQIQTKKTVSRKLISEKDPQLQLALALSMSLHEAQVTEEIEDAHLLAGEPCFPINAEMMEERRKTLQNFGFTTNKPVTASTSGKSRKKRPAGPTLLQIRTQEERDRLTTVRIAEVLMGDEAITQAQLENVEKVIKVEENIILKSRLLRSYHCVEDRLWDKTQQCMSGQSSYSCNLLGISPCKVKPELETKQPELGPSNIETPIQGANDTPDAIDGDSISAPIKLKCTAESSKTKNNKMPIVNHKTDENSAMNLSNDWRSMLGTSYMSDVIVIAKRNVQIYAHQVVLWARCNKILDDVTRHDSEGFWKMQDRILWPETDVLSAEAFLEYVYCGIIERYVSIFNYANRLAEVRVLARKYQLKKLFAYLKDKSNELKLNKMESKPADTSDDISNSFSEEENSSSSVETDINSRSTACDKATSNEPVIEELTSDSCHVVGSKTSKSMNKQENETFFHNLVVDCFSSSNESFVVQIPTTSTSTKITREKLSDRRLSQTISTNAVTPLTDTTDFPNLTRNTMSSSRKSYNAIHTRDSHAEVIDKGLEEERCTSPDIFDDSTTATSTHNSTTLEELQCDPEHDINRSDTDIKVIRISDRNLRDKISDVNTKSDETATATQQNNCRKSGNAQADFTFVSTRRKRRSFKPLSEKGSNLNLECDNLDQEENVTRSLLKKKGDITIAIERIQRLNAKTASESDSECESVETFPIKKHKNPFRINVTQTSSMIDENVKDQVDSRSDNEVPLKRRNALSIFEKHIQLEAAKNPSMFNLTIHKPVSDVHTAKKGCTDSLESKASASQSQNVRFDQQKNIVDSENSIELSQRESLKLNHTVEEILDLTQESSRESKLDSNGGNCNTTIEDQDLSMFSKYKRKHSHNSIDKYRAALKNISSWSSVLGTEDTDEPLSSDDLQSSNDELSDTSKKINCNSFSSRYEYTDPDQSTSNLHRELSNGFLKGKERIKSSRKSMSSTESDHREESIVKLDDAELSDLEINLSDFSTVKSSNKLDDSRADSKSQSLLLPKRKSSNRIFDNKQMADNTCGGMDSFTDVKLEDTEFTIMKDYNGTRKTNISDQDTDTECCIEPLPRSIQPKNIDQLRRQSDIDEDKSSDIYNEETDTGEMEDKHHEQSHSCSKTKVDTMLDTVSKEYCDISSPDCEISGIFSPPSINLDFVVNVTNEVDNLLDECKMSSQILRSTQMNPDYCDSLPTTSVSNVLSFTSRIPNNDSDNINLINEISDSEFGDMEFMVAKDSSTDKSRNNKSANSKSVEVDRGRKTMNKKTDDKHLISESDCSDSEGSIIHKTKSNARISLANRSKAIRKRSEQSMYESVTPVKSSRSSLRTFGVKSVSENIITTKPTSVINFMDDSFDNELARVRTPPIQQNTSSHIDQTTPQQRPRSENVTPLANYSAMKTPELRKELQKYGLKAQKRHRAKQLLRHIYNELHPLVPVADNNVSSHSNESSGEDDTPVPKRLNRSKSFEALNSRKSTNNIESDCETLASSTRTVSDASNDNEWHENDELYTLSQSDNTASLESVFRRLIEVDESLHNKILTYEPLKLEELHSTLKAQGFNCNLNALMDFLDEQCITFRTMANAKKNRTRRKASPKKKPRSPMR